MFVRAVIFFLEIRALSEYRGLDQQVDTDGTKLEIC